VKKRYWVVENERERKKQKRVKGKQTDRLTEKLTKANKKQSMEEMQKKKKKKQRERESYTKWESLRHKNQRPEVVPSLGVAETHYLLLLFTLCFHAMFLRHGL
jgi:hypothetical protein